MTISVFRALRTMIAGSLLLALFVVVLASLTAPVNAAPGINQRINFQGRLLTSSGATAADGFYNVEFKIYQDGDGQSAGNTTGSPAGSLQWTENWLNSAGQGVTVRNGYFSVELGSINPFASQIDWNQDTLYLSVNIGNTTSCTISTSFTADCGGDGEMLPMKRLSSTPYALNAGMLGGRTSEGFIQNGTSVQNAASFNIDGTGIASTFQASTFDVASAGALSIGAANSTSLTIGKADGSASTAITSTSLTLGTAATGTTITSVAQTAANTAGSQLTIVGSTGNGFGQGGAITIQGGTGGLTNANGGNLNLLGGVGTGTGVSGLVIFNTPTFSTSTNDANCFASGALVASSCTITSSSVNSSAAIIVGFSADGQTATLPDPTILTAGRIVYITAANGSSDFTLSVNNGGTGNTIAMRQNTTATMIWNGSDWTAAGASSSTTLQSAYDNTLQSAGGAELVVSNTGNTNGLTIRDSATNPVNGTLLSVQTSSAASLLSVNGNVTEYASDAGAEVAGASSTTFPASTWTAIGASTVTRYTTTGPYINTGQGSVATTTTAVANIGVKNTLTSALTANTPYNVSFAVRLSSGTFTDMNVYYSNNGSNASVPCTVAATATISIWTKVNCTFTTPSTGITASNGILIRQTTATARTFYADNLSVTIAADFNYATDGSVTDGLNFAANWSSVNSATVSRTTSVGNDASDSAEIITPAISLRGIRNKLSVNPLPNTLYRITVYAASTTAGFNSFLVRYSRDGGSNYVNCADYNTQSVSSSTSDFTKITCYITTDGNAPTSPYIYFLQNDAVARTFYVDTFSMSLSSNSTPNVQIGGGVNGGAVTLFTLDRAASAPIASNNDALLGSMYYDTTLGKLQCYEADGWGACGSSPDNIVTISPEYTNAVLHGTGIGTMTSDLCSSTLGINDGTSGQDTICGSGETYNFYKWTSPQNTSQTYSIYVTYQLPGTFKSFNSGQTSLMGRTDDGTNGGGASVSYQVYRNSDSGLTSCGSSINVSSGTVTSWQTKVASGASDPSTCGFNAGDSIVFKIDVVASRTANAYVGNLNFAFSNR